MKSILFLVALSIAPESFAKGFPESTLQRLDNAVDASTVQMMMPGTCQDLKEDENFKNKILEEAVAEENAFRKTLAAQETVARASTVATFGLTWFSKVARHSAPSDRSAAIYNAIYKVGKPASVGSSVVAGGLASMNLARAEKTDVDLVLNSDGLNTYSAEVASHHATILTLGKDEEETLRAAIKTEVMKKLKANDDSPIDFFKVLNKASFKGKPILSPDKKKILGEIELAGSGETKSKSESPQEKYSHLSFLNKFLSVCVDSGKMTKARAMEAKKRIVRNEKVLREVLELAANTGEYLPDEAPEKSSLSAD